MPINLQPIDTLVCSTAANGLPGDWVGLAGLALVTSVMILGVFYIFATLLRHQNGVTFVKLELFEVFATLLIISALFAVVTTTCSVKVGWFFPHSLNSGSTIYNASLAYYDNVELKFAAWMEMQYLINLYVDQMASATPYSRPLDRKSVV